MALFYSLVAKNLKTQAKYLKIRHFFCIRFVYVLSLLSILNIKNHFMMHRTIILLTGLLALFVAPGLVAQTQKTTAEYGKCGYYADNLHGRKTSSGEKYDKKALTCSHKTLPFGTKVRVTRLDNKKSVVVRVNDRGPYMDGYVTDVSRKAAEAIGLTRDGVARVKVEVVKEEQAVKAITVSNRVLPKELEEEPAPVTYSTVPATKSGAKAQAAQAKKGVAPATYSTAAKSLALGATPNPVSDAAVQESETYQISLKPVGKGSFGLQVSSLSTPEHLFREVNKLQATWPGKVVVNHEERKDLGTATYKLLLGPYATRKEAEAQMRKASSKGYKSAFVVELGQ